MPSLENRSLKPEMMDAPDVSAEEFHACLRCLQRINVLTLAYRPTLLWVKKTLARTPPDSAMTIYDIGCGGGDMLRKIRRSVKNKPVLTGIDVNPLAIGYARAATPEIHAVTYDASNIFSFPSGRRADLIISSLFTHHLSDTEIVRFIKWMETHAAKGWFINDLHRHFIPYWFIRCATALFCANRLIVHDAPLSVAKAFTARDWRRLLAEAGVPEGRVSIRWHFPFRYCVSRRME